MNATRRKKIDRLISRMEEIVSEIAEIAEAEQEAYDKLSEKAQEGDKGEAMQTTIDALQSAESDAQSALDYLTDALPAEE